MNDAKLLTQGLREQSVPRARELLNKELGDIATAIERYEAREAELVQKIETRGSVMSQIEEWEELCNEVGPYFDDLPFSKKRALLWAVGLKVMLWRHGHIPRYVINCDGQGLRLGINAHLITMTDQELEIIKQRYVQSRDVATDTQRDTSDGYCDTKNL